MEGSFRIQKSWWKKWKLWASGALLALILYLPVLSLTTSAAGYHRAVGVSIFSTEINPPGYNENIGEWQKIYLIPKELLSLYLQYFSPSNLFFQNDYNPQRRVPGFSVFYLILLPFLFIGCWQLFKRKPTGWKYICIWLLLAPVPASLTRDPFHTYRSLLHYLPITLLITYGFAYIWGLKKKYKLIIITLCFIILSYSTANFLFALLKTTSIVHWKDWDYGYKEISEVIKNEPSNLRIVIDDLYTTPYIHLLFHNVIDIHEYQKTSYAAQNYYLSKENIRPEKIGRFEFRRVDWPSERGNPNTLFIFPAYRLPPSEFAGDPKLQLEKTITAPSGEAAFYILKTLQ